MSRGCPGEVLDDGRGEVELSRTHFWSYQLVISAEIASSGRDRGGGGAPVGWSPTVRGCIPSRNKFARGKQTILQ